MVIIQIRFLGDISTDYSRTTLAPLSFYPSSTHTHRVCLEYGYKQLRVWLEYGYTV